MPEDDRAVRARLAELEAEVTAEADAARALKVAALTRVRAQRAAELEERQALRDRQAELVSRRPRRPSAPAELEADPTDDLDTALALAHRAQGVRAELARPRKAGDKSWVTSGALSLFFGPLGWMYAGSFREAIPAGAAWLALAALFTKVLPFMTFALLPVLLVALPLSAITGVVYAANYNKHGKRTRLFGKAKPRLTAGAKQLPKRT